MRGVTAQRDLFSEEEARPVLGPRADFEAHRHPVLAVACPTCARGPGQWCKRPSEHRAAALHVARREEADRVFISQHGETAWIENLSLASARPSTVGGGIWRVRASAAPLSFDT
jgi:hypothetical protein